MRRGFVAGPPAPCAGGCLGACRPRSSSPLPLLRRSGCPPRAFCSLWLTCAPLPSVAAGVCGCPPRVCWPLPCCSLCGFVLAQAAAPSLARGRRGRRSAARCPPFFPAARKLGLVRPLRAACALWPRPRGVPAAPSAASCLPRLLLPLWWPRLFRSSFSCSRLLPLWLRACPSCCSLFGGSGFSVPLSAAPGWWKS